MVYILDYLSDYDAICHFKLSKTEQNNQKGCLDLMNG